MAQLKVLDSINIENRSSEFSVSPDGKHIAIAQHKKRELLIIELISKEIVKRIPLRNKWDNVVQYSPDGKFLAIASLKNGIDIYDANNFKLKHSLKETKDNVNRLIFYKTDMLASESWNGQIRTWDLKSGSQVNEFLLPENPRAYRMTYNPISKEFVIIAAFKKSYTSKLYLLSENLIVNRIKPFNFTGTCKYLKETDAIYVSPTYKHVIHKLDSSLNIIRDLNKHDKWVNDFVFTPDGKKIISSAADNTLRIFKGNKQLDKLDLRYQIVQIHILSENKFLCSGIMGPKNASKIYVVEY